MIRILYNRVIWFPTQKEDVTKSEKFLFLHKSRLHQVTFSVFIQSVVKVDIINIIDFPTLLLD